MPTDVIRDPHERLRDDVRLLGGVLGDTLRLREGSALFHIVERVRALSKSGRAAAIGTSMRWRSCFGRCRSNPPCRSRAPSRIS